MERSALSLNIKKLFLAISVLMLCTTASKANSSELPPAQAASVGFTESTFEDHFDVRDIDLQDSRRSGFNWYVGRFFGWPPTPEETFDTSTYNQITIKTVWQKSNFEIATAAQIKGGKKWVGTAFGGGGYFEAELKFNPDDVLKAGSKGWPSFWAMAIEHLAGLPAEQWPKQKKGYAHFIEVDVLEYLFKKPGVYGANIHDWFGVWRETCAPKQFCQRNIPYKDVHRIVPADTNFSEYHKYGFLWIPATKSTKGWGQFFFDNKPIGKRISWTLYEDQPPSMKDQPWTFGILDRQHLVLILGTGQDQPMAVRSVHVWQKSAAKNLVQ